MSALTKILTGAAGLAAVVGFASPASAQYYPNYGNNNVLGTIINGVLGGGQYGYGGYGGYGANNERYAVERCTSAVQARLGGNYGGYGGYGYNPYGYNQGYGGGRVLSVTRVERRSSGLRVRGLASSGANYGGYGGYGGYGYNSQAQADLSFSCKVDYRGRITDIDLDRRYNSYGYRGY